MYIHAPLPRLVIPFLSGISLWLHYGTFVLPVYAAVLIVLLFFPRIGRFQGSMRNFKSRWVFGCLAGLQFIAAGYYLAASQHELSCSGHFSRFTQGEGFLKVSLSEPVSEKANSYQLVTRVRYYVGDKDFERTTGRLMIYLEKDSLVPSLAYGDVLIIEADYEELVPPPNPFAFDYSKHLARKNIFHSVYIPSGKWYFTGNNRGNSLMKMALRWRQSALMQIEGMHLQPKESAVLSALVIGYRELLDEDMRREFAGAGAMHILCVSGLHVGIIYLVIKNLLSLFGRIRAHAAARICVVMLIIWVYAAVTGFSPSVLRAAVMFTFVAIGQHLRKPSNVYNTLSASAFVLLTINPLFLAHIGFQLSYLAVTGIVAMQGHFYRFVGFRNRILDKIWSISCVSLAAQLATGPLAVHYFNQFPNYFLLTNLVAIPMAGVILYLWLASLIFAPFPLLVNFCSMLLFRAVQLLTHAVAHVEGLPFSTLTGLYVPLHEVLLLFAIMIACRIYLVGRKRLALFYVLGLSLLMVGSVSTRKIINTFDPAFVVYHAGRETVTDFFTGKALLTTSTDTENRLGGSLDYSVSGMRLRMGKPQHQLILHVSEDTLSHGYPGFSCVGPFVDFHRLRIVFADENLGQLFQSIASGIPPADYLVVAGNPGRDLGEVIRLVNPKKVLLGGSVTPWDAAAWEQACRQAGIGVWNIRTRGAYIGRPQVLSKWVGKMRFQ